MADFISNIHLHALKLLYCNMCDALKSSFREWNSLSWQLRDYWQYFQKMIRVTEGVEWERSEAQQYLNGQAVGITENIFWDMRGLSQTTSIVPDSLHTIYLGMLKHVMVWVISFHKQHSRNNKFNKLAVIMSRYPRFAQLRSPYSRVMKWSGKEMDSLMRGIVPGFASTL
jgi:hypothetical protein